MAYVTSSPVVLDWGDDGIYIQDVTDDYHPHTLTLGEYMERHGKSKRAKCAHCGQWGEEKSECRKCGAPIDPPAPAAIQGAWSLMGGAALDGEGDEKHEPPSLWQHLRMLLGL